jgi:hypothetical protein
MPQYAAGLLRARWAAEEARARSRIQCDTCKREKCNHRKPGGHCYGWHLPEPENSPREWPREGVAVEEGEAGAVWLGDTKTDSLDDSSAAFYISRHIHQARIVGAWIDEEDSEEIILDIHYHATPPYLDAAQLRALSTCIADLYQCAECDGWYRGGAVCPRCGEERKE